MVHRAEAAGPVSTHNTWDMPSPAGPAWHVWRWFKCVVWLPGQEWVANINIQHYPWWNVTDIPALRFKWCKTVSILSSDEKKKYVVLIFENELSLPDQITLEDIFTEMGKCYNISCFPVKLSFEEASIRLKSHNCALKQEVGQDMHLICLSSFTHPHDIPILYIFFFFFLFFVIWFWMSSH